MTLLVGAAGTLLRDRFQERRVTKREREARDAERGKAERDRREAFELETLKQLNNALCDLGRAATRLHLHDMKVSKQTGKHASHQIGDAALVDADRKQIEPCAC